MGRSCGAVHDELLWAIKVAIKASSRRSIKQSLVIGEAQRKSGPKPAHDRLRPLWE